MRPLSAKSDRSKRSNFVNLEVVDWNTDQVTLGRLIPYFRFSMQSNTKFPFKKSRARHIAYVLSMFATDMIKILISPAGDTHVLLLKEIFGKTFCLSIANNYS